MAGSLQGKKILFMVANEGVEQVELTRPWQAVEEAGGTPVLAATETGEVQCFNHLDRADKFQATVSTSDLRADAYDGVVLPGGVANPDQLRMDDSAVGFLREWAQAGRPIAAICHGPWTLVEAGLVSGRTLTSWPSLKTDIGNAGGTWVDKELMVCESGPAPIVTSRKPADLDAFCAAITQLFSEGRVSRAA